MELHNASDVTHIRASAPTRANAGASTFESMKTCCTISLDPKTLVSVESSSRIARITGLPQALELQVQAYRKPRICKCRPIASLGSAQPPREAASVGRGAASLL